MSESTLTSCLSFTPVIAAKMTNLDADVLHQLRISATIVDAIENIDKSTSSLYYELLVHTAAVEQTAFAVECGSTSSCSGQALHVLRCLDHIKTRIDALRYKLYNQNGGSVGDVDQGGSLSLSQLRRKIDELQTKFECALSLISEHRRRLPLSYHVTQGSGGRSLRFVDDDEGDEGDHENKDGDRCLLHQLTLSCSSDHLVNAGECPRSGLGVLDESTICASENGSPIASPPSASRRPRFFPSSLSSRENFRATQRRKAWKSVARSVEAEMSRPCLSLPLFSSEQYSEAPSGGHDVSYALHRRRFRAVKAVDWVETLRPPTIAAASVHDSLADATLVGDLSELLAESLSVRPTAHSASSSTSRPDEGSAVTPPVSTLMASFATSALPSLLESQLRYSYKVKPPPPPPPPPPPAALSAPDAPPSAPALPTVAKAALPASVHSGAPVSIPPSAAAVAPAKEPSVEEEIRRIFTQHNPSKISDVPELLQKYAGKEALLLEKMRKKYEQSPSKPATAGAPTALGSPATTASTGATAGRPTTSSSFAVSNASGGTRNAAPVSAAPTPFSGGGAAAAPTPFSGSAVTSVFTPPKANVPTGTSTFSGGSLGSGAPKSLFGGTAGSLQSPPPAATMSQSQFGNGFGVSSAGNGGAEGIQRRIEEIYRLHNPQKIAEIPQLMQKYAGKELELLDRVQKKYASQPVAAGPSAPSTSLFRSPGAAQGATRPPSFGAGFGSPNVLGGSSAAGGAPGTGLATSLFRK